MNSQPWSKDTTSYQLADGFTLEKSDWQTFSIWFGTHVVLKDNGWFRQSFDFACSVLKDFEICYWVKQDGSRVGGVLIEPNYMNCLFLIPPFCDYGKIVAMLRDLLLSWSDPTKDIIVGGAKPDQIGYFLRAGFRAGEARRCMIRPTESFDVQWRDGLVLEGPSQAQAEEVATLLQAAFADSAGNRSNSREYNLKEVQDYFKYLAKSELVIRASTLVYEEETHKLIGACLVGMWEEWPLVYDVAVHPEHQGKGLASDMLKKALTVLKGEYPVLRLFVTLGNGAETAYHKLGFLAGSEYTEMHLPARVKQG